MSEPLEISVHVEEKRYQPTQEKTVIPGWDRKTVTPSKGYALSKVTVEGMPEPKEKATFTKNGTYNVGRIGTAVVDVGIELQNKTVTPSETKQTVQAGQEFDGLGTVTVNPIPPEYVVPTGSVDITANGQGIDVAGKADVNVNVPQGVFPSGTKVITENVTGEDVTNYAAVDVAVPGPSGKKQISITQNGTTTEDVSEYADAEITVNTDPTKGLVFGDYDSDGYPHSARFVGTWTSIPSYFLRQAITSQTFGRNIKKITIPSGVTTIESFAFGDTSFEEVVFPENVIEIKQQAFAGMSKVHEFVFFDDVTLSGFAPFGTTNTTSYIFGGNVSAIPNSCFLNNRSCVLYDFSHCTAIPPLYSVGSLGHASGCVIRIPTVLSDATLGEGNGWENESNWFDLDDIVWEVINNAE